jgi:GT2 family glycosyltransferase
MASNAVCVSIIVPVHNNPRDLPDCLSALKAAAGVEAEIIVVDDASTDDTPSIAGQKGVRVLQLAKNSGPGAARNHGVAHSRGDIVFFVDSDVAVAPDAVRRVTQVFDDHPEVAAVFGSYDTQPRAKGMIPQYRNLLHHFVHQNSNPDASTFWAGCGAIRRKVFDRVGGFDERRFSRPSIEDIELGYRLRQAGYRILLDKGLQGTHLKRWTLHSMIRTDIICRAIPWSRLIQQTKNMPADLNLKVGQRASFILAVLACVFLVLSGVHVEWLGASAAAILGVVALNRNLYAFFLRQRGLVFAAACVPLHLLYYLYSGLTYLVVWAVFRLKGSREESKHFALKIRSSQRHGARGEN